MNSGKYTYCGLYLDFIGNKRKKIKSQINYFVSFQIIWKLAFQKYSNLQLQLNKFNHALHVVFLKLHFVLFHCVTSVRCCKLIYL